MLMLTPCQWTHLFIYVSNLREFPQIILFLLAASLINHYRTFWKKNFGLIKKEYIKNMKEKKCVCVARGEKNRGEERKGKEERKRKAD